MQGGTLKFLDGGGATGALVRAHDWTSTPLGPPEGWPTELKTLVGVMLAAAQPMFVAWGRDARTMIYNDGYAELMGPKHPTGMGRSFDAVWAEAMDDLEPMVQAIYRGEPIHRDDITLFIDRGEGPREAHFAFSYTPVRDATGEIVALFCPCRETTSEVASRRQASVDRERLSRLFEQSPSFMAMVEGDDYRFTLANPAYLTLAGRTGIIGKSFAEVLPDAVEQGFLDLLDDVRASGKTYVAYGALYERRLGPTAPVEPRFVDFIFQPISGADDRIGGVFIEGYDVTERRAAESALRESEGRFRAAIDAVHGVLWTNSPDGEMLGEQAGWAALTGQTRTEYEGYGWADAVHPDDAHPTIDAWNIAVAERRPFEFQHRVRRHDGEWRHFAIRAIPTFGDNAEIIEWIGVHTDITEERAAQAALRESAEHYRNAAELNPQVVWTATPDGLLDRVAERWRDWTGTSGLGSSWAEGLHADDFGYSAEAWSHSLATGEPYDVEHRVKRIDGSYRWARSRAYPRRDDIGTVVKWYGSTEDIDDRKTAELLARQSADELRGVVESMPGFVWTADDQGGLLYTSPTWHDYSGSQPDDSTGAGWAGFVHPDDRDAAFARWADSLNSGEPYEVEFRLRAADGSYHWWMARARKQDGGGWIGTATELDAIVAARDTLSQSREVLEREVEARTAELRETAEQLRQSQKLEAIGQLTGGVAHDFNNLLTVIRGSVDLLQRPGITDEKRDRYIGAIGDTVVRAAKLTGQLLAFARRQALQPDAFGVGDALAGIGDMIRTLSGSRIRVEIAAPPEPLFIHADPSQFDTAIVNMVANARDAMGGEGTLTIGVAAVDGIPANGVPAVSGDFVAVSITDTGAGIPPEVQLQIFEPFFTTKSVGQGTGLGLSQVYGFAKQSGGEIRLHSMPGAGATFTLYLPRVPAPLEPEATDDVSRLSEGGGTCVLVVEDNPDVGVFAEQTLAELGYDTMLAADGRAALAILTEQADRFQVVFSDVMMPGMTGIELGEEVRRLYPGLPVVLTSGYSHVLAEQGSSGFELLHKPYSMEELSSVLQGAASKRVYA